MDALKRLAPDRREVTGLSIRDILGASFPSTRDVAEAGQCFSPASGWDGSEGLRFRVEVGPGTIGLRTRDSARLERRRSRAKQRGAPQLGAGVWHHEWWRYSITGQSLDGPHGSLLDDGSTLWDDLTVSAPAGNLTPRRVISEWSSKSRSNMVRALAELDWSGFFDVGVPALVTLTYPGDWETVAPDGKTAKAHLRAFGERWYRRWGVRLCGAWKLEFQARGAPHFHLFVVPPVDGAEFRAWLSSTWADVVAHPDPVQRMRHEVAGTAVDYAEGVRARDPKRLAVYFAGHSLKHADGKEYQHVVPELWRAPGAGPGRFWGYWRLDRVVHAAEITAEDFIAARRVLRRWSRARGLSTSRDVQRIDTRSGQIRYRRVQRRRSYVAQSGLSGGWLCVNSGPAFARGLARFLQVRSQGDPPARR